MSKEDSRTMGDTVDPDTVFVWSNEHFSSVLEVKYRVVRSESELLAESVSSAKRIFVLAELDWGDRNLCSFQGFLVLKKLRVELRLVSPIVLCSFLPEAYFGFQTNFGFDPRQQRLFRALSLPGHSLLSLPFHPSQLEGFPLATLTKDQLDQVIDSFFGIDEVRDLIGSDSHPGKLVRDLRRLIRGIRGFEEGRPDSIRGSPYNNALALRNIRRELRLAVSILNEYSLPDALSSYEFETLNSSVDPASPVQNAFQLFIDTAEDFGERLNGLIEIDPVITLDELKQLTLVLPKVKGSLNWC